MKKITLGILAHVDAGKTTLSESILYQCGSIRKLGRVDHQDAFLDNYALERQRGITIFSKQALFDYGETQFTLVDTPGHVDFSAEMERTLQILDVVVLVISGKDGVQGHTETLWYLLKRYQIPAFLFVNKMDQPDADAEGLMEQIRTRLGDGCVNFLSPEESWMEQAAMEDEAAMEEFLETETLQEETKRRLVGERKIFPVFFGSALKQTGVVSLLQGLDRYIQAGRFTDAFGAKVYKIGRDSQGNRLTYLKITGGSLKTKTQLKEKEKVNQIRFYSGEKYELADMAYAGDVCAVTGLTDTYPGEGLGAAGESVAPFLVPVLTYQILLPPEANRLDALGKLRKLEEEIPELHMVWNEKVGEIHVQMMGEVQTEILKSLVQERFGLEIDFGPGSIVYKETIEEATVGVGHFEPLRHYAEVHLRLEPLETGSGLVFDSCCSEDILDRNWQRLVLTHLEEKEHLGVLTGAPITDMKITLTTGRAHKKHTEGGDFRQATYRAVRQGLKSAKSRLLEPVFSFTLEIPTENVGRAMTDLQNRFAKMSPPLVNGERTILTGKAPVETMEGYQTEVMSYTKGKGRLFTTVSGYEPCHNEADVIAAKGYDSESDLENPTGSVFCTHGAGFVVSWDQVLLYCHMENPDLEWADEPEEEWDPISYRKESSHYEITEDEIQEIFQRTFGSEHPRRTQRVSRKTTTYSTAATSYVGKKKTHQEEYLLVDGYNIIFAWHELVEIAKTNLEGARNRLMDLLCNYQGIRKCHLILVFDAYKVKGNPGEVLAYHNIHVVFTKEAETADQYIEKVAHKMGRTYDVIVATSDALEQVIILGQGCQRMSANGLWEEMQQANHQIQETYQQKQETGKNYLLDALDENSQEAIKQLQTQEQKGET